MVETMTTRRNVLLGAAFGVLAGAGAWNAFTAAGAPSGPTNTFQVNHSDDEWRHMLSPAAYDVLRNAGTEQPYSSPLNNEHRSGTFTCAGCGQALFASNTKFDSGTGWPSFYQALDNATAGRRDNSLGMTRDEILCSRCGGHLGHVFDDGPPPTGLRFCMNGVAMGFKPS
jgi:peptide-methionine (R)-S-oxide reductase